MTVLILNGSPKGKNSITLQTVNYLAALYPKINFEILHVGQRIRKYEKDFTEAADALLRADLVMFTYPVYTFIAPYQLHRFIELIKESGISLAGKFATQLTTSKHFYDVTAHRYVQDNCSDLGMKYIRGLSADMDDLTGVKGQKEAKAYIMKLETEKKTLESAYEKALRAAAEAQEKVNSITAQLAEGSAGFFRWHGESEKNCLRRKWRWHLHSM